MYKYTCGVDVRYCRGSATTVSAGLSNKIKRTHASPAEAFKCHAHYLVNVEGYTQTAPREFQKDDGPVRVLTKKSRFGGKLRGGKRGEGGGTNASRVMPHVRTGGIITST